MEPMATHPSESSGRKPPGRRVRHARFRAQRRLCRCAREIRGRGAWADNFSSHFCFMWMDQLLHHFVKPWLRPSRLSAFAKGIGSETGVLRWCEMGFCPSTVRMLHMFHLSLGFKGHLYHRASLCLFEFQGRCLCPRVKGDLFPRVLRVPFEDGPQRGSFKRGVLSYQGTFWISLPDMLFTL